MTMLLTIMDFEQLKALSKNLGQQRCALNHYANQLEQQIKIINNAIIQLCPEHDYIIDFTYYEPCGRKPRVCKVCGHTI